VDAARGFFAGEEVAGGETFMETDIGRGTEPLILFRAGDENVASETVLARGSK
jgi:hypothetical protein